jgi:hypothetical protein
MCEGVRRRRSPLDYGNGLLSTSRLALSRTRSSKE